MDQRLGRVMLTAAYPSAGDRGGRWLRGGGLILGRLPVPGQEFVEPESGMIGDAGEHVGEPGLRVDAAVGHTRTPDGTGIIAATAP